MANSEELTMPRTVVHAKIGGIGSRLVARLQAGRIASARTLRRNKPSMFCYACGDTPLPLKGSQSQVSCSAPIMLISVLNLVTRIKLGQHMLRARHAPGPCAGGPMTRGAWALEFSWPGGSRQTMTVTATSAPRR